MKLRYKAVSKEGKIVQGIIDANGQPDAAMYLRSKDLVPIKISQVKSNLITDLIPVFNKVGANELIMFTRQLSSMLTSGLTLLKSLQIYREQTKNEKMAEVVSGIISDVEEGKTFSTALSNYPNVFSSIYVSIVKAGESSGLLDKVLERLADNLEKQAKLKSTIKGALTYPVIVITLMIAVIFLMMIFVIPQLTVLYQNMDIELPMTTQIVVGLSNFTIKFWPLMIGGAFLSMYGINRWKKTENGKLIIDDLLLKLPVFGKLIKETILTEFSRTFGVLIGTGALVVEALQQTADTTGNIHYRNAILSVSQQVEKGVAISDSLASNPLFPAMLVQLVKVGEQTGKVDENLEKASEYYEREVNQTVKTLTTAMEPFIMIVLGVGVAFLILSVITPIYSLMSSIQ